MTASRLVATIALLVTTQPAFAGDLDLPIRYDVAAKPLKTGAPAGTLLTIAVHATPDCSDTPLIDGDFPIEDLQIEAVKLLAPKGAAKPPKTARLRTVIPGVPVPENMFVRVTGSGVVPVGGDCQPQEATSGEANTCGNGVIDGGEDCEAGQLGGYTCVSLPPPYPSFGFGGTLRCGAGCRYDYTDCRTTRYINHGDGTVTDVLTGLQWARTDDNGGVTDKDNMYTWSASGSAPDGTVFTDYLPRMNGQKCETSACTGVGGHSDWRLPTLQELGTIIPSLLCDTGPCIDESVFGPTQSAPYATSSSYEPSPTLVWYRWFAPPSTGGGASAKTGLNYFRAVR